jgi:hypothetical protein
MYCSGVKKVNSILFFKTPCYISFNTFMGIIPETFKFHDDVFHLPDL